MNRSLYPNGVEVDTAALSYTESTLIAQILYRTLASNSPGIVTGGAITINGGDNTAFDVAPCIAIVPNGEQAVFAGLADNHLASNVSGTVNLITLVYTETQGVPAPSEDGQNIYNTQVTSAGVLMVYTAAQYAALTTAQLAVTQVIGKITATGGAIGTITSFTPFSNVLAVTQPVTITGVTIASIDESTPTGTGQLQFSTTSGLQWMAPTDVAFGSYVNVSISGNYTLTSNNGDTIVVTVVATSLPTTPPTITENIMVSSLYSQVIEGYTAEDFQHRSMLGTGIASPTNPHALTLEDLGGSQGQFLQEHQDLEHATAIRRGSASNCLLASVVPVSGINPDYVALVAPLSSDVYYVEGYQLSTITASTVTFTSPAPVSTIALYDIIIDASGNPSRVLRLQHPATTNITGVAVVDISDSIAAGSYNLVYNYPASTIQWNGGTPVYVRGNGNYVVYGSDLNWIVVNIGVTDGGLGFGVVPSSGTTFTDSITVFAHSDRHATLWDCNVAWDGDHNLGFKTTVGGTRVPTDKRLFGTTSLNELGQDAISLFEESDGVSITVGNGTTTFGTYNGPSGIQQAVTSLTSGGTIAVLSGTYDPFSVTGSNIQVIGVGAVIIDGDSGTGATITNSGSFNTYENLTLQNCNVGISQVSGSGNRGVNITYASSLTQNLLWTAGANNSYKEQAQREVLSVSANTAITPLNSIVLVNAASGALNMTLPLSANCINPITFNKTDTTVNAVTLTASGSDKIGLAQQWTSINFDDSDESVTLQPVSGGWIKL